MISWYGNWGDAETLQVPFEKLKSKTDWPEVVTRITVHQFMSISRFNSNKRRPNYR